MDRVYRIHRSSSRDSNSPTINGLAEKPPFKLCFSRNRLLGKSYIRSHEMTGDSMAPNFYPNEYDPPRSDDLEKLAPLERGNLEDNGYPCHLLTSHAYGWWYERGIRPEDPPFNYRKTISELVPFRMKLYGEDDKLRRSKR